MKKLNKIFLTLLSLSIIFILLFWSLSWNIFPETENPENKPVITSKQEKKENARSRLAEEFENWLSRQKRNDLNSFGDKENLFKTEFGELKESFLGAGAEKIPETTPKTAEIFNKISEEEYFHFFFQDWYIEYLRGMEGYMKESGFLSEKTVIPLNSLDDVIEFLNLFADYLAFGEDPIDEIGQKQIIEFRKSIAALPSLYRQKYSEFNFEGGSNFKNYNFQRQLLALFYLNSAKATYAPTEINGIDVLEKMGASPPDLANILNISVGDMARILNIPVGSLPDIISITDILKSPEIIQNLSAGNFGKLADVIGIKTGDLASLLSLNSVADLTNLLGVAGLASFLPLGEFGEIMGQLNQAYTIVASAAAIISIVGTGGLSALISLPGVVNIINIPGISDTVGSIPGIGGFIGGFGGCKSWEPPLCSRESNPLNATVGWSTLAPCCSCYKKVRKKCRPIGCLNKVCSSGNAIFDYSGYPPLGLPPKICGCG